MPMMLQNVACAAAVALCVCFALWDDERAQPAGRIAPDEPLQGEPLDAGPISIGSFVIEARASYQLTARVLSHRRYTYDGLAALVPIDIAFGWGEMSDTAVLSRLSISQSGRWYYWSARGPTLPIPRDAIIRSSANTHLIPMSEEVRETLLRARTGDILRLDGELVDIFKDGKIFARTSLTRTDTGGGSCEIMYVRQAEIVP